MIRKLKWLLKPFLTCAIIAIALSSCDFDVTNSEGEGENSISNVKTINAVEAQKFFAKTLSVAAAKSSALRTFLKNEAEKQYDKDKDVNTKGYQMYSLNTGGIDIVIAPKNLR